jgi:hypothetical protein
MRNTKVHRTKEITGRKPYQQPNAYPTRENHISRFNRLEKAATNQRLTTI